jgi:hypothetical protein
MRIRTVATIGIFAGVLLPVASFAQTRTYYRKLTPDQDAQRTYDGLFLGISLDSTQAETAKKLIRQSLADLHAQYASAALSDDYRQKVVALADRRKTALLGLLPTAGDSAQFEVNETRVDAQLRAIAPRGR